MEFVVQIILKTEFGEYKGEKLKVNEDQFNNITSLSSNFYQTGFEMILEDGSFMVLAPEAVKRSILLIKKQEIKNNK